MLHNVEIFNFLGAAAAAAAGWERRRVGMCQLGVSTGAPDLRGFLGICEVWGCEVWKIWEI